MNILIFAGPSGGHLFPALAFAETFLKRYPDASLHLVTSRRAVGFVSAPDFSVFKEIHFLHEFPFPSGISLKSLSFLLQLPRAFLTSYQILKKIKPDLCVGFGSFVSYPGMMLSAWMKIPNFIHEQNQVPGKATLWLASSMDCAAESFPNTFRRKPRRVRATGLPIRPRLLEPADLPRGGQSAGRFRILIVGGSQGSKRLNEIIFSVFSSFPSREKNEMAVTHITGRQDFELIREKYRSLEMKSEIYPFCENMEQLYRNADLAVTRAGANTLFELAYFQVPAIVVPYPHAGNHQKENARVFAEAGALLSFEEPVLAENPRLLASALLDLKSDAGKRERMSQTIKRMATPDAGEKLADLAEEFLANNIPFTHEREKLRERQHVNL